MNNSLILHTDKAKDLKFFTLMFETLGFTVRSTLNHMKIAELVESEKPKVIFIDVYSNGSQGNEICTAIKMDNRFTNIPIILYRGKCHHLFSDNIDYGCLKTKADHIITTPSINYGDLKILLDSLINPHN